MSQDATLRYIDPVDNEEVSRKRKGINNLVRYLLDLQTTIQITLVNLKLELCKATFTEEKVTLVAQYVEKLKPELKEMLDRLTAIHLIYQMVRGVWLRVKSDSFSFYQIT